MIDREKIIDRIRPVFMLIWLFPIVASAQNQPGLPKPSGPVDPSETTELVIYILIPAIILIGFLIFRKRIIKIKKEKRERLRKKMEEKRKESEE